MKAIGDNAGRIGNLNITPEVLAELLHAQTSAAPPETVTKFTTDEHG